MPPLVLETPRALKDFAGREIATTQWFTLTQERIAQFAEVTEDRQWIHTDPERARKESPYGSTIAHGFLTLSLASHLLKEAIEIRGARLVVNYGLNRVRFPAPVLAGARIRARIAVESEKEEAHAVEATFRVVTECEGQAKPCCVAEWVVRYYL